MNYLQKELSKSDYISIRTDLLNDMKGQRDSELPPATAFQKAMQIEEEIWTRAVN